MILKTKLDVLYEGFNVEQSATDPIHLVRRYQRDEDREVAGFCAAVQSIERLFAVMGDSPAAYVRRFDPRRDAGLLMPIVHRWTRGADLVALIWVLQRMLARGSLEQFFLDGDDASSPDIGGALDSFSARAIGLDLRPAYGRVPARPGVCYFFPRPSAGSGCKRLNLFLRWMVRRDQIDFGIWRRVSPARLVVPLDTHVIRVGQCLGLTRYRSPGWRMAIDITAALRAIDPDDPIKYDFSMCHLGMMNACGFNRAQRDSQCPLRGACRPGRRTPRSSRQPSDRR
jgi:uncharacterized protein (TIGR02757 family)